MTFKIKKKLDLTAYKFDNVVDYNALIKKLTYNGYVWEGNETKLYEYTPLMFTENNYHGYIALENGVAFPSTYRPPFMNVKEFKTKNITIKKWAEGGYICND